MQGLEIDGCIVRRALLPAPRAEADPFERQRSYGSLMGLALVALLLVVHLGPEGMPDRLRRPCDKRVPEARGTREAPAHLGLRAAPCGSWRDPSIFLEFGGGGIAFALVAKGDQETRSEDRARSWQGLAQGEIGMALRALAVSQSARAYTRSALGAMTPSSVVRGMADVLAWIRWAMTSA